MVTRIIDGWLTIDEREDLPEGFAVWRMSEQPSDQLDIPSLLAPQIAEHLFSTELLEAAVRNLPTSLLQQFIASRMPGSGILRRGVFGEVLSVRVLEEFHDYEVPIRKLRFRTASHDSPKATDVLALKVRDGTIQEVAYVEAKFRSTRAGLSDLIFEAHDQLQKDCSESIPAIVGFAAQVLVDQRHTLADALLNYLRRRSQEPLDVHHVMLVVESARWRDTDLDKLKAHDSLLEPLHVHIVRIEGLVGRTDTTYGAVGVVASLTDD